MFFYNSLHDLDMIENPAASTELVKFLSLNTAADAVDKLNVKTKSLE